MNLWKISIKNIRSKALTSLLSVLVLALSIGLLFGVQQLKTSFKYQIENNLGDIDLVIGAKGSPLQLVLSSVLHIDNPTGNIPYSEFERIKKNPMMKRVVPVSYGDNYKGYRIVGTTPDFKEFYNAEIQEGRDVKKSLEVVLGHAVAERLNLKLGDTFLSSHGLVDNDVHVHTDVLTIVGILKPTQKVIDRLILTNLQSVWDVHDHDHGDHGANDNHDHHEHSNDDHDHAHDSTEDKEVTSLLISFRNPVALLTFPRNINEKTNMQAALPKYELERLYKFTGVGFKTISWIAYFILLISGATIFVSLYKMVKERKFDLALMRTYGASNFQLMRIIAYEGFLIVCIAVVIGLLFSRLGIQFMFTYLDNSQQQLILQNLALTEYLQILGIVFVIVLLAVFLAIYPILRMNISNILSRDS